jgi:hypothetical protein
MAFGGCCEKPLCSSSGPGEPLRQRYMLIVEQQSVITNSPLLRRFHTHAPDANDVCANRVHPDVDEV